MADRPGAVPPPPARPAPGDGDDADPAPAVAPRAPGPGGGRIVLPAPPAAARGHGAAGGGSVLGRLHRPGDSLVHALPAHCKLLAVLGFVLVVVATPREALWAFAGYAALLAAAGAVARVPAGFALRRMLIEAPFLAFAVLLPFVAEGPRTSLEWLGGVTVSEPGLWSAWNILAKGTLGVAASVLLAATTEVRELLLGLQRLRLPPLLVQIASFMARYADVVAGELRRMRVARASRGFTARGPRHWAVLARTAGALFIRCYERGERVHLAMLSRGYAGSMPILDQRPATAAEWGGAAVLPGAAVAVLVVLAVLPGATP